MRTILTGLIGIALAAGAGWAEEAKPFLRIETGMHTAAIRGIGADAAGRYLVTGSHDKTVRVWDLANGELLRILRLPIGEGDVGKVYSVAISPDGETIAVGGWMEEKGEKGKSLYLFERRTGRLRQRISGLPEVVFDLAFSRDSARLVAALGAANGIRLFRTSDGQELGRDTAYEGDSYGADFDRTGRLVTTTSDAGHIRLYNSALQLVAKVQAPGGRNPVGIAFSPDGSRIAVGYGDQARVDVLSAEDLRLLYSADTSGAAGEPFAVAWSLDGTALYAAGQLSKKGERILRRWADAGRGAWRDLPGSGNTIQDLHPLEDGQLAFGASDPAWAVLGADGQFLHRQRPATVDLRGLGDGFRTAADGRTVRFTQKTGAKRPSFFALPGRILLSAPPRESSLPPPRSSAPGLEIAGWKDTAQPAVNGKPLELEAFERSRSVAVAPDNHSFLLGTVWQLRSFTRSGEARWAKPVPGTALAVQVTGDGRLALAAFSDGTIRWYRYSDGQELLALFPHIDGKRWVLWTPSGYYDASVGAEDLIGWHVNRGPDQEADFYSAWHFREQYRRPDVIDLILETLDEKEALRRAGVTSAALSPSPKPLPLPPLPPIVTLLDPAPGASVTGSPVKIRINVRSPSGAPVTAVRARVDGRPITSRGDVVYQPEAATPSKDFYREIDIPVPPRDCIVEVLAEAGGAVSEPARLQLRWAPPAPKLERRLFVLAVGISKYQNPAFRLGFADRDATEVAAAWKRVGAKGYTSVETRVLTNEDATHDAILDALEELNRKTGRDDTTVIFLAGHGVNDGGYFFLPWDADLRSRYKTLVPGTFLQDALLRLQGRVVLFLDTCRAGSLESPGGAGDLRRRVDATDFLNRLIYSAAGVVVFSAANGQQLSMESEEWRHGAFTKILLEGLDGAADLTRDGRVNPSELDTYLKDGVEKLTGGAQSPVFNKSSSVLDFVLVETGG